MKILIRLSFLACFVYLQSCGDGAIKHKSDTEKSGNGAHANIPVPDANRNLVVESEKDIVGYWVGEFYPYLAFKGNVNISIDEIKGSNVTGHSMIAGTFNRFTGTMTKDNNVYRFSINQDGTEKYNGKFELNIADGDSVLRCTWAPKNTSKKYDSRWGLKKKLFSYNSDNKLIENRFIDFNKTKKGKPFIEEDGTENNNTSYAMTTADLTTYNASADLLTKDEVANMKKADILIIRNSIFARHGYAFKKDHLSDYFQYQDWYVPVSTDVTAELTTLEKKNIELLMRYEKNAKDYYSTYGR